MYPWWRHTSCLRLEKVCKGYKKKLWRVPAFPAAGSKHFKRDNSKNAGFASGSHKGCVQIIHCGCLWITKLLHICHVINFVVGLTWRLNLAPKQWGWDWIWILTAYQSALKCKLRTETKAVGTTIQIGIWEQSSWALHRNVIGRPKQSQVRWWLGYRLRQLILEGWYIFIQGTGIVMLPLWKLSHNYTMKFIYNG